VDALYKSTFTFTYLNNLENNVIFTIYLHLEDKHKMTAVAVTNQSSFLIPELVTK